jgi:uncharacterized membrane protein (DUF485 family)
MLMFDTCSGTEGDGMTTTGERARRTVYQDVQDSPDFRELRSRLRRFVFPASIGFLVWYLAFIMLASYAREFMAIKLLGNINMGLVIGLLQFVSTFALTTIYVRYAERRLDPLAEQLRVRIEGSGR